ncbi:ATP-dependent DNA helicase [Methanolobus psychrotolerans]|uniref:ATP-dependent DNA helicase n=1 Tax=Methanolobus psychrotolerans TaxID=1874706 RepID=UPI0013ED37F6|nr:ATP-dependent DNA helicase [Methanolobus psychrotolerans]
MNNNTCSEIYDWFPYAEYRQHQREMLEVAQQIGLEGSIGLIDAPTGSGKSSIVASLLSVLEKKKASGEDKKILVAVRTKSQLNTFINELDRIRKEKRSDLTFCSLIGKQDLCLIPCKEDKYEVCKVLQHNSRELIQKGIVPEGHKEEHLTNYDFTDAPIFEQTKVCPFYLNSRETNDKGQMVFTKELESLANFILKNTLYLDDTVNLCKRENVCPYEAVLAATKNADVIIVNFLHIFNDKLNPGEIPTNSLILIDEAHNIGNTVQSIQTTDIVKKDFDFIREDIDALLKDRPQLKNHADNIFSLVEAIELFSHMHVIAEDKNDVFLYENLKEIIFRKCGPEKREFCEDNYLKVYSKLKDDLNIISHEIEARKINSMDLTGNSIQRLQAFMENLEKLKSISSFLPVYSIDDKSEVNLEIRNIDPSERIKQVANEYDCCLMVSGTLSPLEVFSQYYFGNEKVVTHFVPNAFPEENRRLICIKDVTSAYKKRNCLDNLERTLRCMETFCSIDGNLAIFFPSYEVLNIYRTEIEARISNKELFIEPRDSKEAEEVIKKFKSLPGDGKSGLILGVCGGKLCEGIDYPGDMLVGAFVYGLPLAQWNNIQKRINAYYESKYGSDGTFIAYNLPAINKTIQSLGRVIRNKDDKGFLVIADERYSFPLYRNNLSPWMKEEIIYCDSVDFEGYVGDWTKDE